MTRSRLAALQQAARSDCICGGGWAATVVSSLMANMIPIPVLCADIVKALIQGRSEVVPVLVLVGARGGEGKSMMLKALYAVFGDEYVFSKPEVGNFPLIDLPGKHVVFLDDWRFDASVISYATQCLWYDGSAVPIVRPQNQPGMQGHFLYRGTAPIFATSKADAIAKLRYRASENPQTGTPWDADASMLLRRLKIYEFNVRVEKPANIIPYCAHCFGNLVLQQAAAHDSSLK
eukprot:201874-Karenia_brevis.AAC.1